MNHLNHTPWWNVKTNLFPHPSPRLSFASGDEQQHMMMRQAALSSSNESSNNNNNNSITVDLSSFGHRRHQQASLFSPIVRAAAAPLMYSSHQNDHHHHHHRHPVIDDSRRSNAFTGGGPTTSSTFSDTFLLPATNQQQHHYQQPVSAYLWLPPSIGSNTASNASIEAALQTAFQHHHHTTNHHHHHDHFSPALQQEQPSVMILGDNYFTTTAAAVATTALTQSSLPDTTNKEQPTELPIPSTMQHDSSFKSTGLGLGISNSNSNSSNKNKLTSIPGALSQKGKKRRTTAENDKNKNKTTSKKKSKTAGNSTGPGALGALAQTSLPFTTQNQRQLTSSSPSLRNASIKKKSKTAGNSTGPGALGALAQTSLPFTTQNQRQLASSLSSLQNASIKIPRDNSKKKTSKNGSSRNATALSKIPPQTGSERRTQKDDKSIEKKHSKNKKFVQGTSAMKVARQKVKKTRGFVPWFIQEDEALKRAVDEQKSQRGQATKTLWSVVAKQAGLERRTAYQCRQRWNDSIRPGLKKGEWTMQEEESIHQMYQAMGPKWIAMAKMMPSRSNNDIKNKWHQMTRKEARLSQTSSEPRKLDTAVMEVDYSFSSDAAATSTSSITIDMTTITRSEAV